MLREKHPQIRQPELENVDWKSFEDYPAPRRGVPVDCDQDIVQGMGGKLSGGAGPNSVDGEAFKRYLLKHGIHSRALHEEMALWVVFLANNIVPYAAHRALETGRLTALDKQPGVRPIGVASAAS